MHNLKGEEMNENLFNAAMAAKGMTREDLAQKLSISRNSLTLKIKRGGDFRRDEIATMYQIFGKKSVDAFLYA